MVVGEDTYSGSNDCLLLYSVRSLDDPGTLRIQLSSSYYTVNPNARCGPCVKK